MKKLELSKRFQKKLKKLVQNNPSLNKKVVDRINIFLKDKNNPVLKDHSLVGSFAGKRSFSITGDIRIIYAEDANFYYFLDIGTHSQVY